jgi:adenylate cyclase
VHLRVGIHLGDVVESEGDISGDAVNVASRVVGLADSDGVCITRQVYDQVRNKSELPLESIGMKSLKNVSEPMEVFRLVLPWEPQQLSGPPVSLDKRRIAVLPLTNMSHDPADEYFADGLTEELICTMSRIGGLRVIARTSVMGYKGARKKIEEIAEELDVGTILEGSVRKAGERARIAIQLIDTSTSEHLWAESYDRELKDVLAVQTDIAKTVAEALKVRLTSQEKAIMEKEKTTDPEALTLYLKGRFYWNERTKEGVSKALECFELAVKIDPEFAPAYSGLADCYNIQADYGWVPQEKTGPLARQHSLKALAIDDSLAEAHASYALTLIRDWDFVPAQRELRRALELRPNYAVAHHWHAILLSYQRRNEEALQEERLALELDPYSRVIGMGAANTLSFLGREEEALQTIDRLVELNPEFAPARMWRSGILVVTGETEAAVKEAERAAAIDDSPVLEGNLAWVYAVAGRRADAERVRAHLYARMGDDHVPTALAGMLELAMGNLDEGFRRLERGIEARDTALLMIPNDPWFRQFATDPRWKAIEERLGIPRSVPEGA